MSLQKHDNANAQEMEQATLPEEMSQVLDKLPENEQSIIKQLWFSQSSMISRISPEFDVAKKVTSEHIDKLLDTQDKAMEKAFKDKGQRRVFMLLLTLLAATVLIALVVLLKDKPEFMEKIVTIVFSGSLGAAGGYGIGVHKNRDED